jgi:hypothetical protein
MTGKKQHEISKQATDGFVVYSFIHHIKSCDKRLSPDNFLLGMGIMSHGGNWCMMRAVTIAKALRPPLDWRNFGGKMEEFLNEVRAHSFFPPKFPSIQRSP